jgi:hypothetical protein
VSELPRPVIIAIDATHRIKVYAEGGRAYEVLVPGIGWVIDDEAEADENTPLENSSEKSVDDAKQSP